MYIFINWYFHKEAPLKIQQFYATKFLKVQKHCSLEIFFFNIYKLSGLCMRTR